MGKDRKLPWVTVYVSVPRGYLHEPKAIFYAVFRRLHGVRAELQYLPPQRQPDGGFSDASFTFFDTDEAAADRLAEALYAVAMERGFDVTPFIFTSDHHK